MSVVPLRRPVILEVSPCPDPWHVAQAFANHDHLIFFDSADRHATRGRYSYVAADPVVWFDHLENTFQDLKGLTSRCHLDIIEGLPPFQGGVAGLFGYGLGRQLEKIPPMRHDDLGVPDLGVGVYDWVIAFDHEQNRCWIVSTGCTVTSDHHRSLILDPTRSERRAHEIMGIISGITPTLPLPRSGRSVGVDNLPEWIVPQYPLHNRDGVTSNFSRDDYLKVVERAIEYIRAGDVFQVNLAQRLLTRMTDPALTLYGKLRSASPASYSGYLDLGKQQILSASPEQFLQVSSTGIVRTRPIKGTRPRGPNPKQDLLIRNELLSNPKDRAENVMIVDLMRNDLGRVCEYGSIYVPKVCEVESYHYVHHLVSEVIGRLHRDLSPWDVWLAAFPGGSVTGAPKVRAMEIIAELEPTARGAYCGSLGFIAFNGSMDSNILIRTVTAGSGWLQFPVGGGIVADSDPSQEYNETLHKAAGILLALGIPTNDTMESGG